ncbi:Hypothetical predicted protein [Paramuricea clavata]|uniref:Uncharacterized protein n=1 Tax=Paramuricea clavata TaxID=317549 RepID=A0A6S7I672_PARCT|nr:Hypothetical predicted protein [Paramuricea clavata]
MKGSRKRQPEVIVFEEPARKQRRHNVRQERFPSTNHDVGSINFKEIAREVRELGVSGFKKKDQRRYKQQHAQALGAKAPKKQKMPYPLLMELKKIKDEKEQKKKELENAMGIFKKKKSDKDKQILQGSGRWVDRSKGLDGGKFKKGVRKVKQKDVAKFKKSKT